MFKNGAFPKHLIGPIPGYFPYNKWYKFMNILSIFVIPTLIILLIGGIKHIELILNYGDGYSFFTVVCLCSYVIYYFCTISFILYSILYMRFFNSRCKMIGSIVLLLFVLYLIGLYDIGYFIYFSSIPIFILFCGMFSIHRERGKITLRYKM